jgi:hypothetical protein
MIPKFLAPQGPEIFLSKLLPSLFREVALVVVVMFTAVVILVGVARKILAAGTKFSQMSTAVPLGATVGMSDSGHHRS